MMRRFLGMPFLFILASLLQLGYVSSTVVSPEQILRPLFVLWLLVALLIWPAYRLARDWNWTVMLLTVFVLGVTFSSDFFPLVLTFLAIAGVGWLAVLRLKRARPQLTQFMYILGGTSLLFAAYTVALQSAMLTRIPWMGYRQAIAEARNDSISPLSISLPKRDIYYIVLDGYVRADVLQEMFDFENAEFIAYLQDKGFIVPASSQSNYPATPLSLASTLNMDYIQSLVPSLGATPHRWLMAPFIDHGRVRSVLEFQGYETISMSTNWTITDNITSDRYLHPFPVMLTDFEGFLLDRTPLQAFEPLLGTFSSLPTPESHRMIIQYNFSTLAELAGTPGPKFIFVHMITPHPPFVFDQDGHPLDSIGSFTFQDANEFPGSLTEYRQNYIGQVQFVNYRLQETIDAILEQSDIPPIILLQADHGSGMLTDLTSAENTCIRERFSPFAAYYLPGVKTEVIPPDIATVNLFRVVLNEYFGAQLPLLENKQYFYRDTQAYYDFEDVSGRLDDTCALPRE